MLTLHFSVLSFAFLALNTKSTAGKCSRCPSTLLGQRSTSPTSCTFLAEVVYFLSLVADLKTNIPVTCYSPLAVESAHDLFYFREFVLAFCLNTALSLFYKNVLI